tara:strand:+ start:467 stop:697 length:231 start_codon:yes stop_codon:yes gene_type:complete
MRPCRVRRIAWRANLVLVISWNCSVGMPVDASSREACSAVRVVAHMSAIHAVAETASPFCRSMRPSAQAISFIVAP